METTTRPRAIFSMLDGYRPITNLLGAGDPNVHRIDGRWWMYFGGFQRDFTNNLFSAYLPAGARLGDGTAWTITTGSARPGRAAPLIEQPARGEWDRRGLHEPCFVSGWKQTPDGERVPCRRIYYTGRSSRRAQGNETPYAIGFLEHTPDGWRRHGAPVVTGDSANPSTLGPKVVFADGKWRMWFRASPHEPAKGEQPVCEIRYTESTDGITWSPPWPFHSREHSFAHAYVLQRPDRCEMLLSTSPNVFGQSRYPEQGLWLSTSAGPSGDVRDWSKPRLLVGAAGGPAWLRNGFFGASLCADDADGGGRRHVFFTGVHASIDWPRYALRSLAALRRPPVPAPFYFTIGHLTLDIDAPGAAGAERGPEEGLASS
ncbi:hypothetical protein [Streptomonospora litoralis]|uniref:Uncharacterized protein n=1 Tax=Streptomonospora litoralis TaxID=2498135 RepID=A0A4P6Q347_9ACTN|nr:hypothetical protein [Streptomonospora litoralis]QBI53087.1 hypothetical protein EKD16_06445 [Streptomonospora litoralis]